MEDISGSALTSPILKGTFVKWMLANPSHRHSKTHPATSVNLYTKQLGGRKREEKKKSNCYCMPLLHSAAITDITFGCKTLTEKDFVRKLQKSTCINTQNSGCTPDPCKHKHCYDVCCKKPHRRPLSCSYPA